VRVDERKPLVVGGAPTTEDPRDVPLGGPVQGLLITFDTYQVAPGAAGPQKIVVPYSELTAVIDPQGPLAAVMK